MATKKAVLYARVSSDRQEKEGFSIPAQVKLLREYAKRNNISIVEEFIESETAKKAGRTQFNNMVKYLKKNTTVRNILVEKTDRLYRNLKDYVTLDDISGLAIHFCKEGNVLSAESKSQDKFMHGIRVLMAKNYIDNLSEEIRKGLNEKCAQGFYPSSPPMGYVNKQNEDGRKKLVVDPTVAPFIKQIFVNYLMGKYTYKSLAEHMHACGFRPKKRNCTAKTIENILHNEFYTGIFIYKGVKYYNAKHDAIISPELFMRVQEKMKSKYKIAPKRHNFAYSGFIKCKHCGRPLIAELQHGRHKKGNYIYYRCHGCKSPALRQDEFENAFLKYVLNKLHFSRECINEITGIAKELVTMESEFACVSADELNKKIKLLQRRLSQLYTDKCDGIIDTETYISKRDEWQHELDVALVKYEKIAKTGKEFAGDVETLLNLCKNAPQLYLSQTSEEKRKLMNLITSNPFYNGSTIEFPLVSAFEYAIKLRNLETAGVEPASKMITNANLQV